MTPSVILLHGILRQPRSMQGLARLLERHGFGVANLAYPSRRGSIDDHARLIQPMAAQLAAQGPLSLVGHSMGGLVIRRMMQLFPELPVARVVMLGTPNGGSEVADFLQHNPLYRWLYGKSGQQLTTAYPRDAALPTSTEIGIIAGNRSYDPVCSWIIKRPSDGKVAVESTKLPGMHAHLILPAGHSLMPSRRDVQQATLRFLQTGRFGG